MDLLRKIWWSFSRRKQLDSGDHKQQLKRALTLLDLIGLGVGSTLGLGVYVLAGSVAHNIAGPGVCLSFLVAAVASAFAGICYSEFASRVPQAGSAYVYSYVSVGEFIAFSIGWNLILEYVIGTASVAKGMSNYIDALSGKAISRDLSYIFPISVSFLSDYPDFLAFGLVVVVTVLLAIGVKESATITKVFCLLNLITIIIIVIAGSTKADPNNWNIDKSAIDEDHKASAGEGGFLPWGIAGVMKGAARCFFGFVGFDCVATTGEEAKNPKKNIPRSIVLSLLIIFVSYFSIAVVITMMVPYYLQDGEAPFPHAFKTVNLPTISYVVSVGAICALSSSLLGAMFPLPRIVYSMSSDGLLPRFMAKVHAKTMTPIIATALTGIFGALMATVFNLEQLIDMMSIGTLMAYSIVAISILILRYEPEPTEIKSIDQDYSLWKSFKFILNLNGNKASDELTSKISNVSIFAFVFFSLVICVVYEWWEGFSGLKLGVVISCVTFLVICAVILMRQPQQNVGDLSFKVPLVPIVPCLSILMNLYLMTKLDGPTWMRFIVWLAIGYSIYFVYGVKNSSENVKAIVKQDKKEEITKTTL